jgi:hypothetical protein
MPENGVEFNEAEKLRQKIYELAESLPVNKANKVNQACFRDPDTEAIVCARVTYISDSAQKVSGYAKVGNRKIIAVGDSKDIKDLENTIGP